MRTKRNGEIDFLRFLCAVAIVVHHYNELFPADLMHHGYTFVKFFFLVTGYFMAHSIAKLDSRPRSCAEIANTTWAFLFKKIRSFYPYYFFGIIVQLVLFQIVYGYNGFSSTVHMFLESVPTFTLTFYGMNLNTSLYLASSWYLSVMVLSLFILFPIALRYRDAATRIFFPLLSVFLMGYLNTTFGVVSPQTQWTGFCAGGMLQGITQIALGASLYSLVEYWNANPQWQAATKNRGVKLFLTFIKLLCYWAVFSHGQNAAIEDIHALLLLAVGVLITFSGSGYTIPESRITRYLGRIALPIYMFHSIFRYPLYSALAYYFPTPKLCLCLSALSIILSIFLMYFVDLCMRPIRAACKKAFCTE